MIKTSAISILLRTFLLLSLLFLTAERSYGATVQQFILANSDGFKICNVLKDSAIPSTEVQVKPEFPGGEKGLFKYLSETIRYPKSAREELHEEVVNAYFVVDQNGKVGKVSMHKPIVGRLGQITIVCASDGKIVVNPNPKGDKSIEAEALRAVESMPDWKPGLQDGQPVEVAFTQPIYFKMQSNFDIKELSKPHKK